MSNSSDYYPNIGDYIWLCSRHNTHRVGALVLDIDRNWNDLYLDIATTNADLLYRRARLYNYSAQRKTGVLVFGRSEAVGFKSGNYVDVSPAMPLESLALSEQLETVQEAETRTNIKAGTILLVLLVVLPLFVAFVWSQL